MGRRVGNRNIPRPKPVEKIELSKRHIKQRTILTALLLVIGMAALGYALYSYFAAESGWQEIAADNAAALSGREEFVLLYELGSGDLSASAEKKALTALYTEALQTSYRLFDNDMLYEGISNVRYINQHPNETITVDASLYQAFSLVQRCGSRYLYLAPAYAYYDNIFYCHDDSELVNFDPHLSEAVRADFDALAAFARDPGAVDLQLLDGNRVVLKVSEAYLQYASENGVESFIDFYWMKNAFMTDYLAQRLAADGYSAGCISSYDGFVRNLDGRGTQYAFALYNRSEQTVYQAETMRYTGPESIVFLRGYPLNSLDSRHYYELADGQIRTPYLDIADGLNRSALDNLVMYSGDLGCAELALRAAPVYIADSFREDALRALAEEGIGSIYFKDGKAVYVTPQEKR